MKKNQNQKFGNNKFQIFIKMTALLMKLQENKQKLI